MILLQRHTGSARIDVPVPISRSAVEPVPAGAFRNICRHRVRACVLTYHELLRNLVVASAIEFAHRIGVHKEQPALLAVGNGDLPSVGDIGGKKCHAAGTKFEIVKVDACGVRGCEPVNYLEAASVEL